jgi:hypothetical protein
MFSTRLINVTGSKANRDIIQYSETSLNRPVLGTKNMAGLEGLPVL